MCLSRQAEQLEIEQFLSAQKAQIDRLSLAVCRQLKIFDGRYEDVRHGWIIVAIKHRKRYDPQLGSLSTFLRKRVGEAIYYSGITYEHTRFPTYVRPMINAVVELWNREPDLTVACVANRLSVPEAVVYLVQSGVRMRPAQSLYAPVPGMENTRLIDIIVDTNESNLEEHITTQQRLDMVKKAMLLLTPKQRSVIEQLYLSGEEVSLPELAQRIGVTSTRVRQVHNEALAMLRSHILPQQREVA